MSLALITGGSKRVGAAIAARLAADGHRLALHSHKPSALEPALAERLAELGTEWELFPAELADSDALTGMMAAIERRFGEVPSILVNNASLFTEDQWRDASMASLTEHFQVNAAAPFLLAQAVAKAASADRPGVIVNILDQRIAHPHGDQISYTSSKLALAGLTQTLARTLAPHVRVSGVAPGLTIVTPAYSTEQVERLTGMMPLQRLPTAEDVAEAVIYLINARATTGQVLFVDGGAGLESWPADFVNL